MRILVPSNPLAQGVCLTFDSRGESGSGKTEIARLITRHLIDLTKSHICAKKTRIQSAALRVNTILNAFTRFWASSQNQNSSAANTYHEYQFDIDGNFVGFRTILYALEKSRVSIVPEEQRSFNIFHWLLAGSSASEKKEWSLHDPNYYCYLKEHCCQRNQNVEDSSSFSELKDTLKSLGFGRKQQAQILKLVSASLLLGNITFSDPSPDFNDGLTVKSVDVLGSISSLLGVEPADLEVTLTYRTKIIRKETCCVILDHKGAIKQRDALAQTIFAIIVKWLLEKINRKVCHEQDCVNVIGVIDFAGFRNDRVNGLDTFLVNYANEKLREAAFYTVFELPVIDMFQDGMVVPRTLFPSSQDVLDLLDGNDSNSIFSLIDSETCKSKRNNGASLVKKFKVNGEAHAYYINDPSPGHFGIRHYAENVVYDADSFIEMNTNESMTDFRTLLCDSTCFFIKNLLTTASVSAQSLYTPSRRPFHRKPYQDLVSAQTTIGNFKYDLQELIDTFRESQPWLVMTFRPNVSLPGFNVKVIEKQIQRLAVAEMCHSFGSRYSTKQLQTEFQARYRGILANLSIRDYIETQRWTEYDVLVGQSYIFISDSVWKHLEKSLTAQNWDRSGSVHFPQKLEMDQQSNTSLFTDSDSHFDSEYFCSTNHTLTDPTEKDLETGLLSKSLSPKGFGTTYVDAEETVGMSSARRKWLCCVWSLTWWIPTVFLRSCGGMQRAEVQMAWREKVALCAIIFIFCGLCTTSTSLLS